MQLDFARRLEAAISAPFVGREEEARVAVLALLTRQHAVLIGEPGIAKTSLLLRAAQLVKCRFFPYTVNRHTVPDELLGPIDPIAYRQEGRFERIIANRLPDAEIVFIDEIFRCNSETLNALLTIMNERVFVNVDGRVIKVPLWSLFGASNEVPNDPELAAFYDRFLLKHFVSRIDSSLLEQAIIRNLTMTFDTTHLADLNEIKRLYDEVTEYMREHAHAIAKNVAQIVVALRQHGIFVSDRTATSREHLPRLVATLCHVYGFDVKEATIRAAKYILPTLEAHEAFKSVLESFYPVELREAKEKFEQAKMKVAQKNLAEAKTLAAQALSAARAIFAKPDKAALFKGEIEDFIRQCENFITELEEVEKRLHELTKK